MSIFIKNRDAPQELHRSVLQFIKISVNLLNESILTARSPNGIAPMIIQIIFSNKMNPMLKKHRLLIRKIINKLIRKLGSEYVTRLMPEYHKKMIAYLEKEKRKKLNKK